MTRFFGFTGNDTLVGLNGNDILRGGGGADQMTAASAMTVSMSTARWTRFLRPPDKARTRCSRPSASCSARRSRISHCSAQPPSTARATHSPTPSRANSGNNILDGGLGTDVLNGGLGNDTYVLANGTDAVIDSAGTDTITTTITRSLASYSAAIEKSHSARRGGDQRHPATRSPTPSSAIAATTSSMAGLAPMC